MPTSFQLEIEDDVNDSLEKLARKHRRSKRMEAIVAIETYIDSFEAMLPSAPAAELSTEMEVE